MKKLIFGLALVLSLGLLASCNNVYTVQDVNATVYETYYVNTSGTGTLKISTQGLAEDDAKVLKTVTTANFTDYLYTSVSIETNPNSNGVKYTINNLKASKVTEKDADGEVLDEEENVLYLFDAIEIVKIGDTYYSKGITSSGLPYPTNSIPVTFTETDDGYTLSLSESLIEKDSYGKTIYDISGSLTFTKR